MSDSPLFKGAFPYQQDVLALPVVDLDAASQWYAAAFGLQELERRDQPRPAVILERDGIKIGFAINGGDASQDGAAILVSDIYRAKEELEAAALRSGIGGSTSTRARNVKSSSSSRLTDSATTSTNPFRPS